VIFYFFAGSLVCELIKLKFSSAILVWCKLKTKCHDYNKLYRPAFLGTWKHYAREYSGPFRDRPIPSLLRLPLPLCCERTKQPAALPSETVAARHSSWLSIAASWRSFQWHYGSSGGYCSDEWGHEEDENARTAMSMHAARLHLSSAGGHHHQQWPLPPFPL
jgi:hypothetical protein